MSNSNGEIRVVEPKDPDEVIEHKTYYDNGQLEECYFKVGNDLHGERKLYHKNGIPWIFLNYDHGKRHGECKEWVYSGQLIRRDQYDNDQLISSRVWYEDGILMEVAKYKNGKLDGEYSWYNEYGQRLKHLSYTNGKIVSDLEFDWD